MAITIAALTFVMTTVIFLTIWQLYKSKTSQEIVRGRIEELHAAEKWAGIATNLRLVRDEIYSTVPVLHRLMAQAPGTIWAQKFISQAGLKTKPAKLMLLSIVIGAITYT